MIKKSNNFKPTYDWSNQEALDMFNNSSFSFQIDKIYYNDFLNSVNIIPDNSVSK